MCTIPSVCATAYLKDPSVSVGGRDLKSRQPLDCGLHTLIHTFAPESPLPNIVVAPIKLDINIPAIDV